MANPVMGYCLNTYINLYLYILGVDKEILTNIEFIYAVSIKVCLIRNKQNIPSLSKARFYQEKFPPQKCTYPLVVQTHNDIM